jgi:enoyl-CoA hydratase
MTDISAARLRVLDRETHLLAILDRPAARNAIDQALVTELHELCAALERRPRVLVITGAEGVFAAGADIRELRDRGPEEALNGINSRVFQRVADLPLPTIAAVDGPAFGGGAELAYACDFRIASQGAKFGNPEVNLGIIAGAGACWRLRELVGRPLAAEMLLAGRRLDADEALAHGLVSQVVPAEELDDAAAALAARICTGSALALQLTKLALGAPASAHPAVDDIAQAVLFQTAEKRQRMSDFLDKKGRP